MISAWFFVLTHAIPISLLTRLEIRPHPKNPRKVAEEVEQKIILAEVELDAWLFDPAKVDAMPTGP